jgi:cytochrome c oxidase cbb3-type subunit 4
MDVNVLREAVTVVSFAVFLGIVWFAAHPRNGKRFEQAAALPPDEEGK